jgi:hypothetical protein
MLFRSADECAKVRMFAAGGAVGANGLTRPATCCGKLGPLSRIYVDERSVHGRQSRCSPCRHVLLVGTNTGPGGSGHRVRISGFEVWQIGADGLVAESRGHFDSAAYQRQIERGVGGAAR